MKKVLCMLWATMLALTVATPTFAEGYRMDYAVTVAPQYEAVSGFRGGLAAVKKDGLWGYINEAGEMVVEPQYAYAASFFEGKALVGTAEGEVVTNWTGSEPLTLGLIDAAGNHQPLMTPTSDGGEEKLVIESGQYMNFEGSVDETTQMYIMLATPKNFGYFNGYLCIPNGWEYAADTDAPTLIFDKNGKFVDNAVTVTFGDWTGTMYLGGIFSDSLFAGESPMGEESPFIAFFDENKNLVAKFNRWPNSEDETLIFNSVYDYFDGFAGSWGGIATDSMYCKDVFVFVNRQGEILFQGDYHSTYGIYRAGDQGFDTLNDGRIVLMNTDGAWGAVDMYGNEMIPFIYEDMQTFSEGLCGIKKDGLWGFVDTKNNTVITPQYQRATHFNGGIALVEKDGMPMVIDRYNNVLEGADKVPLSYYFRDRIYPLGEQIVLEENGKYGFAELTYNTALPKAEEMSVWAYPEVCKAIENNLVPLYLQNQYFENIRRDDFAQLIVRALEEVSGKDAKELLAEKTGLSMADAYAQNPFKDTNRDDILIANRLGIINGVSASAFAPSSLISRQDAATLLMRAAKLLKGDIAVENASFADDAAIADYAKQAISYVTTLKIMNGVGEERFDPTATYTREQAYVTIVRLFESLQ